MLKTESWVLWFPTCSKDWILGVQPQTEDWILDPQQKGNTWVPNMFRWTESWGPKLKTESRVPRWILDPALNFGSSVESWVSRWILDPALKPRWILGPALNLGSRLEWRKTRRTFQIELLQNYGIIALQIFRLTDVVSVTRDVLSCHEIQTSGPQNPSEKIII